MFLRKLARRLALLASAAARADERAAARRSTIRPSSRGCAFSRCKKARPIRSRASWSTLKLLFWDAKSTEANPRNVLVAILSHEACENPPGDLYYNCFDRPRRHRGATPDGNMPDWRRCPTARTCPTPATSGRRRVAEGGALASAPSAVARPVRADHAGKRSLRFRIGRSVELCGRDTPRAGDARTQRHRPHPWKAPFASARSIIKRPQPGVDALRARLRALRGVRRHPASRAQCGPQHSCLSAASIADGRQLGADDFVVWIHVDVRLTKIGSNNNPVIDDFFFDARRSRARRPTKPSSFTSRAARTAIAPSAPSTTLKPAINRSYGRKGRRSERSDARRAAARGTDVGQLLHHGRRVQELGDGSSTTPRKVGTRRTKRNSPHPPSPVRCAFFAVVHDNRGGVAWVEGKIIVD